MILTNKKQKGHGMSGNEKCRNYVALEFNRGIADKLIDICQPLNKYFGINFFGYAHFLENGTYLDFCTNMNWQSNYLRKYGSHSFISAFVNNIYQHKVKYILWENTPNLPDSHKMTVFEKNMLAKFIDESCHYGICHGFTIYKYKNKSIEAWHFATTKENGKIIKFCINNIESLEHFILYFRDKASDLIKVDDVENLIVLQDKKILAKNPLQVTHDHQTQMFNKHAEIKNFSMDTKHGVVLLSKREAECAKHLITSKTMKEIAKRMEISPRTVEHYLNNIKNKIGCWSKSELIEELSDSSLRFFITKATNTLRG